METFSVVIEGRCLDGFVPREVHIHLARMIGKSEETAAKLLSGSETKVKSGVDTATGERYTKALSAIGVACRAEPEQLAFDLSAQGAPVARTAPAQAANEKPRPTAASVNSAISNEAAIVKPAADYGMFLLAIPFVATLLIWFWVSGMNLFQSPGDTMALIMLGTILGTAIVAALEASKVGMKSDREKGTYSATAWFFIITLLWVVGYPVYLFKRKYFGLANRLVPGILVALVFVGSWGFMNTFIEGKKTEIRANLGKVQQQTNPLQNGAAPQATQSQALLDIAPSQCPSSEGEMTAIMLGYNSKVALMLADHPEQANLIMAYQSKFMAASHQIDAAYIRRSPSVACQTLINLRPELDAIEGRICGGPLCAH